MNMNSPLAIKIVSGSSAGQGIPLKETLFVGSGDQCEIQITDPGISALHARIDRRGNAYNLVDLTDASGVKVNGRFIKSRKLVLHDKITIGDIDMEIVKLDEMTFPTPPSAPPEPVVMVGTEPSAKASEMDELAEEEGDGAVEEEHRRPPERVSARRPQYYRPEVAIRAKRSAGSRISRYIIVTFIVLAVVFLMGLLWRAKQESDRQAWRIYQEAADFARAHPDDPELVIKKYEEALRDCASRPELGRSLVVELEKLKARRVRNERGVE